MLIPTLRHRALASLLSRAGHRLAVMEQTRFCNRRCPACSVPLDYHPDSERTLAETVAMVDRLAQWGYPALSYMGGEATADTLTKEGISIWEHTLTVLRHAVSRGMIVNLTSNGDYLSPSKIRALQQAGLSFLTLSLHSYSRESLDSLLLRLQDAAERKIIPVLSTVFTAQRTLHIPSIARYAVQHGVFFGVGICQTYGGAFSKGSSALVPTRGEQEDVFSALRALKAFGMIRTNRNYLRNATRHFRNDWKCDPLRDSFIHVGVGGSLDVCSEVRTHFRVEDLTSLDDVHWRKEKLIRVATCRNCLHQCHFETQNPDVVGDIPTALVMLLSQAGGWRVVQRWGSLAARRVIETHPRPDWFLTLPGTTTARGCGVQAETPADVLGVFRKPA